MSKKIGRVQRLSVIMRRSGKDQGVENNQIFSDITLECSGGPSTGAFNELWLSAGFSHSSGTSCLKRLTINVRAKIAMKVSDKPRSEGNGAIRF